MNVMQRHMLFRILGSAAGLSAVLTLMALIIAMPRLMYLLAQGAISLHWFLLATAVLLPSRLDNMVLFAITVATLHIYAGAGLSNEIVSLRMAGLSDRALALPGLGAAAVGMVLTAFLSLYAVPISLGTFSDILYAADFDLSLDLLDEGYPQQISPNLSISFRRRLGTNQLGDVTILDGRKADRFTYIVAHQASLIKRPGTDEDRVLILRDGSYQERRASEEESSPIEFDELTVPIPSGSSRVREWHGSYEEPTWRLLHPPPEVKADPTLYGIWTMDAHQRIALPLECLSYTTLALGLILTASFRDRIATMLRAGAALVGIAVCRGTLLSTHPLFTSMPSQIPFYYVIAIIPGTIGVLLLVSKEFSRRRAGHNALWRAAVGAADARPESLGGGARL